MDNFKTFNWLIGSILAATVLIGCQIAGVNDTVQPGIEVRTDEGQVRGRIEGDTRIFLGIPYASSPTGDRRWRPPGPVAHWRGERDARNQGPICTQGEGGRAGQGVEDCLVVNVWTPNPAPSELLPVLVWIHGGGFVLGSGNNPMLDGQRLSEAGPMVVVNFNYRLGLLGFLALPQLSAESPTNSSGAYGFLDQVAALEWVKRNIASFGGDPSQVTLGGNSAGAMSVCYHLVSPASRGLFHRAILQSGSCTRTTPILEDYEEQGTQVVAKLGCEGEVDVLGCMRSREARRIMDAFEPAGSDPGGEFFQQSGTVWEIPPAVDHFFLDQAVVSSLNAGEVAKVPVIIGANQDEGAFFIYGQPVPGDEEGYIAALKRRYDQRAHEVLSEYPLNDFGNPAQALAKIAGDEIFFCPTQQTARYLRQAGLNVFLYKFEQPLGNLGEPWTRAFHTSEIPFVFGSAHWFTELGQTDLEFSAIVMRYWARFIATGDPNIDGAMPWPTYDSDSHMVLSEPPRVANNFSDKHCQFWAQFSAQQTN